MKLIVKKVKDGLVTIGTENKSSQSIPFTYGEVVNFENGARGLLLSASETEALVSLLSDSDKQEISVGMSLNLTGEVFKVRCAEEMIGRVVDYAGNIVVTGLETEADLKKVIKNEKSVPIVVDANKPDLIYRKKIDRPIKTGILAIDTAIPIGMGQRELLLGDRQTGKTAIAIDMIINQKGQDVICIYNSIGKKNNKTIQIFNELRKKGCLDYTIFVNSSSSEFVTAQFISPYTTMAIAEYFQSQNKDVLVIFDDLTKHANAYRTISLLLNRSPGREAYPGDIFYLHSRLLERAGQFTSEKGGGSITAIPIVESQAEDFSAFIPTNIISITDGQIFTSNSAFNNNERPAINIPLSVSRIGSAAQNGSLKTYGTPLKGLISQYEGLKKIAKFSGSLSKENARIMDRGTILSSLFLQKDNCPINYELESIMIILFQNDLLNMMQSEHVSKFKKVLETFATTNDESKKFLDFIGINLKFVNKDLFDSICKSLYGPLVKKFLLANCQDPNIEIEIRRKLITISAMTESEYSTLLRKVN
jgi:F-type H+-transporting ATPase subunit alpha